MKKTFSSNSEVCHVWAQRIQEEGKANSIFFESDSIFSYGKHFEIARFVDFPEKTIVLFTTRDYSVTTSSHKSMVMGSISHYSIIRVPTFDDHDKNLQYFSDTLNDYLKSFVNSRTKGNFWQSEIENLMSEIDLYLKYFKKNCQNKKLLKILEKNLKSFQNDTLLSGDQQEKIKARIKETKQQKALETKKRNDSLKEDLKRWQNGENIEKNFYGLPIALRIKGEEIETTKGAKVPVNKALILCNMIETGQNIEGFEIGHYTINRITENNLIAGCHTIPLKEIKRIHELIK